MSCLLLAHERATGGVEVLLADTETSENGLRVFRRGGDVVLRVGHDEVVVVRDVRDHDRAQASRDAAKPVPFGQSVAER